MKKFLFMSLCLVVFAAFSGCSTIKGIGEDVSAIGGWIEKGSDNVKENINMDKVDRN